MRFHDLALCIHKINTTVKNIYALRMVKDMLSSDFEGSVSLSIDLQNNLTMSGLVMSVCLDGMVLDGEPPNRLMVCRRFFW
jgi:hypothetical protein